MTNDRAAPGWLTSVTFAHRGLHSIERPENAISAVEAAIESGFGIECDIQMSRDNVALVFHDWELDRLTAQRGKVAQRSAEELCRLALLETDDTIWTLTDLLALVAGRVPVLIEVKSLPHFDIASACAVIAANLEGYPGPVGVMSFDPRMGEWFARHQPDTVRGLVTTDSYDHGFLSAWRRPFALERAQPDFLASDIRDLPNALAQIWREAGRPLLTWTVRTSALRTHALLHADAMIAEGEGIG